MTTRRTLFSLFAIALLAGCQSNKTTDPAAATTAHNAKVKQVIDDGSRRYTNALLKKDTGTLQKMWADDLVFINPRGQVKTKEQRLADIRAGQTSFKQIDISDLVIRPHGQHAVATCRSLIVGQYSGQDGSGDYRIMLVWEDRGGDWLITAIQMTKIQ